jgi:multiple sugar transport system ATP-binding protein
MRLGNLIEEINYIELVNIDHLDEQIESITYNSKKVKQNSLFICLPGEHVDGHEYAEEALANGAVVESDVTGYELLGKEAMLYFSIAGTHMSAVVPADTQARYGDHVKLAFDPIKIHVFDKETELTITN